MNEGITYVGMDVHKKDISVAMLLPGKDSPVQWKVANEPKAVRRMVKKMVRLLERCGAVTKPGHADTR